MITFSQLNNRLKSFNFGEGTDFRLYIIGDIHSMSTWKEFYQEYQKDNHPNKKFIFLGDIVDSQFRDDKATDIKLEQHRKMLSKGAFDNINDIDRLLKSDKNCWFTIGNHELMRLHSLYSVIPQNKWVYDVHTQFEENYKINNPDIYELDSR